MEKLQYILGKGELLTESIVVKRKSFDRKYPYTFSESVERLTPQFSKASFDLNSLPDEACPFGLAMETITLNPSFIAKSYFPNDLFRELGLDSIGSSNETITPERWLKKEPPKSTITTKLFVAGFRSALSNVPSAISEFQPESSEAKDLQKIESVSTHNPVKYNEHDLLGEQVFEVVLNWAPSFTLKDLQRSFLKYAKLCSVTTHPDLAFSTGLLWFIPVSGTAINMKALSKFSLVRVVRLMPKLRTLPFREKKIFTTNSVKLPDASPLDSSIRVAILDGGLPDNHSITPWVSQLIKSDPSAGNAPHAISHGLSVSSAFLFGPLPETGIAETPYAPLTHIRVIDDKSELDDPFTLPRTLEFVEEVLLSNQYDFINLSLRPNLPIEDTDIHVWTSILDSTLSDGSTLMTVAAGNNGEHDQLSGNARIQVPADCVNALAVGAADCDSHEWKRASYSAFGPGRSPGFIKPDLVAFGGSDNNMFSTLDCEGLSETSGNMGTSFAAPYLLRSAVGIKASLGNSISILGTKALLIHCAERACYDSKEVGWGRAPSLLEELILCPETESRIIYQGILKPGKYLRFNIPLPKNFLDGPVKIRATVCITTQIDPQDTSSYTRAGVNVTFRPNSKNYAKNAKHQKSKPFFTNSDYSYEDDLRVSGKWETVLKAEKNFHSTSLYEPCFDVHYNAREYGGKSSSRDFISYALILSLITPKTPNLTQKIIEEYPVLTQIRPRIQIARIEA